MKYTREDLLNMGMSVDQVETFLLKQEEKEKEEAIAEAPAPKREYTESDITSISDIVKYTSGTIVRLPDFADGAPFIAKLKRPSMIGLMKTGKIPNSLLKQATQLFKSGAASLGKDTSLDDLYDIMDIIVGEALVQPSYEEIKKAGVTLADDQVMAIFSYTQNGVKALEQFR